jgi:hypothetical protein
MHLVVLCSLQHAQVACGVGHHVKVQGSMAPPRKGSVVLIGNATKITSRLLHCSDSKLAIDHLQC